MSLRFTREVVEDFLRANEGYMSKGRTQGFLRYPVTTYYKIERGCVYMCEEGKTVEEPHWEMLCEEDEREFIKSELKRYSNHLVIPEKYKDLI